MSDLTEAIEKQTRVVQDLRRRIRALEDEAKKKEAAEGLAVATKKKLSEKERAEIRAIFDQYDTDKSGGLNPKEVEDCAAKLGAKMTADELSAAVKALDTNNDGNISFDEFVDWFTSDKKLGGLSGAKLAAVRLKMRMQKVQRGALSHMSTVDRSEGVGYSVSVRTTRPFEPKFTISATSIPMPDGMTFDSPAARKALPDYNWSSHRDIMVGHARVRCEDAAKFIQSIADDSMLTFEKDIGGSVDESDPTIAHLYTAMHGMKNPVEKVFSTQPIAISLDVPHTFGELINHALHGSLIGALSEFSINTSAAINPQVNFIALFNTISQDFSSMKTWVPLLASIGSRGGSLAVSACPIDQAISQHVAGLLRATVDTLKKKNPEMDVSALQTPAFAQYIRTAFEDTMVPNVKSALLSHLKFSDDSVDATEDEFAKKCQYITRLTNMLRSGSPSEILGVTISTKDSIISVQAPGLNIKDIVGVLPKEGENVPWLKQLLEELKASYSVPMSLDLQLGKAIFSLGAPLEAMFDKTPKACRPSFTGGGGGGGSDDGTSSAGDGGGSCTSDDEAAMSSDLSS